MKNNAGTNTSEMTDAQRPAPEQAKMAMPVCVEEGYQLQHEHDTWAKRPGNRWPCPACAAIKNSRKLDEWATFGIVEVASRNRNVKEYVEHWEGRALKAEAALATRSETARTYEQGLEDAAKVCEKTVYMGTQPTATGIKTTLIESEDWAKNVVGISYAAAIRALKKGKP